MEALTPEARFQYCVGIVLEHEGGLSKDKRDPGGTTNWGVSLRFLRAAAIDIDGDGDSDEDDIVALDKHGAVEIYRKHWWDKFHYNAFNALGVAAKVFDLSVNMGSKAAHKLLQQAINNLSKQKIVVDGIIGGKTIGAANALDGQQLRQELRELSKERYMLIVRRNPNMAWALKGWLRRASW